MDFGADQIFGGHLLGVRSVAGFTFYDWSTGVLVRRIDVTPVSVHWSENGNQVAICTKDAFYILRYRPEVIVEAMIQGITDPDGVEAAFEVMSFLYLWEVDASPLEKSIYPVPIHSFHPCPLTSDKSPLANSRW